MEKNMIVINIDGWEIIYIGYISLNKVFPTLLYIPFTFLAG